MVCTLKYITISSTVLGFQCKSMKPWSQNCYLDTLSYKRGGAFLILFVQTDLGCVHL